ncbi:MAG: type transport system permease protein [Solirubrobacterales bacterium]|jgi:ABC-2 type transport system permease protein|nr:type transport system permease protein [Solirubrobacterales bacterium]
MSGEAGLELHDVRGPSALGGGWRRFTELLLLLSVTEFKRTYFGTVLGYFWSLLRPLLLFAVLLFVFTKIFRLGSGVPHYPVLLLFNVVLFGFFSESTQAAVQSVVSQESVVRKTQFPRMVIPLSVVLTAFFNLGMNLIVVLVFILAFGVSPTWTWLLFPLIVATLFVYATAVSLLLSSLYVRFRDTAIIWTVMATALFYATPVLYPIERVPSTYLDLILLNPLTPLFIQARHWVIDPSAPTAVSASGGWTHLLAPIALFAVICALGGWYFNHEAPRIAEEL